ncbi:MULTISPECIES: NAD(P)-binding domain-containing protein [Rhodobacterales]|uniref:NAD(P)-binding domain-containing protein n=1 Tax=Rhodobacterales TaxID=204455 RepID=UPI00215D9A91|nr:MULTISPECIES: NAD(P)-binding domain-containing protein [Rhodobacterales]MDO6590096.1 NAD(P)-binding domain-containing protein [Yoonia sp. 1_MG-2023]
MTKIIGVAGCGRMGGPMLANLQSAGFDARGYDPRASAGVGTDVDTFCEGLTTLITVVRDAAETDALLFEDQNVVASARALQTIVISSTLSPNYVKSLRARIPPHITIIDAPMSGAQVRARAGALTFYGRWRFNADYAAFADDGCSDPSDGQLRRRNDGQGFE